MSWGRHWPRRPLKASLSGHMSSGCSRVCACKRVRGCKPGCVCPSAGPNRVEAAQPGMGRLGLSARVPQRAHPSPAWCRAFCSVYTSGASRTTARRTSLPSSGHSFLLGSGTGAGLPEVVRKPFRQCLPRFAAMTFNTSGMIKNRRTDVGGDAGLQVVATRPCLPAGGPARGAGGQRLAA